MSPVVSSVQPVMQVAPAELVNSGSQQPVKKVRVLFDYNPTTEEELAIKEGDIVDVHDMQPDGWWYGELNGKRGYFPSNFVSEDLDAKANSNDSLPAPSNPEQSSSAVKCVASYDYDAADENELSFREGDVIELISQAPDGWWYGSLSGKQGLFPSNYVKLLS